MQRPLSNKSLYAAISIFVMAASGTASVAAGGYATRMAAVDASREALQVEVVPFRGCVVDEIIVKGNTHTRRWTIIREMATKEGERLDEDVLYRDHSYLRGLGFFSSVDITIKEASTGHCNVIVSVAERPDLFMKYPMPSLNYDLEKGVSYGVRWRIRNFQGRGQEFFAGFEQRREHEQGGRFSWSMPWVGVRRMRLSLQAFSHQRLTVPEKADFIKEQHGGGITMGFPLTRSLLRQVWIMPEVTLENRHSRLGVDGPPNQNGLFVRQLLLVTGLTLTYDSRDNLTSPFRGAFAGARVRRFTSIDGYGQQYSFMHLTAAYYLPVSSYGSLIFAFAGDNRDGQLPWFYQLGMGGMNDLRGHLESDARGTTRLLSTLQWRKNVYGPNVFDLPLIGKFDLALNAIAFADNGALMDSIDDAPGSRFFSTGGFGVEILSPIQNIIRLEVAFSERGVPSYYIATRSRF